MTEQKTVDFTVQYDEAELIDSVLRIVRNERSRRVVEVYDELHKARSDASALVKEHGMTGGEHHKQWVIDQLLQIILGELEYAAWFRRYDYEAMQSGTKRWDYGIAP